VPADFAAQVAALGGKVLWVSPGSGLAAVRGLQGSAAAKLAGKQGIQAVEADALLALEVPRLAMDATAEGGGVAGNAPPAASVCETPLLTAEPSPPWSSTARAHARPRAAPRRARRGEQRARSAWECRSAPAAATVRSGRSSTASSTPRSTAPV